MSTVPPRHMGYRTVPAPRKLPISLPLLCTGLSLPCRRITLPAPLGGTPYFPLRHMGYRTVPTLRKLPISLPLLCTGLSLPCRRTALPAPLE